MIISGNPFVSVLETVLATLIIAGGKIEIIPNPKRRWWNVFWEPVSIIKSVAEGSL